jgi:hypothetical protein
MAFLEGLNNCTCPAEAPEWGVGRTNPQSIYLAQNQGEQNVPDQTLPECDPAGSDADAVNLVAAWALKTGQHWHAPVSNSQIFTPVSAQAVILMPATTAVIFNLTAPIPDSTVWFQPPTGATGQTLRVLGWFSWWMLGGGVRRENINFLNQQFVAPPGHLMSGIFYSLVGGVTGSVELISCLGTVLGTISGSTSSGNPVDVGALAT